MGGVVGLWGGGGGVQDTTRVCDNDPDDEMEDMRGSSDVNTVQALAGCTPM